MTASQYEEIIKSVIIIPKEQDKEIIAILDVIAKEST